MVEAQNVKTAVAVAPVSLSAATGTAISIDTQGFSYARYELTTGAGTVSASAFKVQESDTSGGSYTDISGATISVLPGASDNNKVFAIMFPITGKRWHEVVLTATGAAGLYGVNVQLSRAAESPNTAAERGLESQTIV